jgi:hypothetical protein
VSEGFDVSRQPKNILFFLAEAPQLAASFISGQACDVAYWHRTDMPTLLSNVRYRGHSRRHSLAASISPFDPEATSNGLPSL